MHRTLGVALWGLGTYSRNELAPALRMTRHCRLVGVITPEADKGRDWAMSEGFPLANVWHPDAIADLAARRDVDIVYLVTPNALHAGQAIALAQAGKHIICEKPFTVTAAEAERVLAACRVAGVKCAIGYRLHFDPHWNELIRLAREKDFGPFTRMTGKIAAIVRERAWRVDGKLSGGGPLMDIGVYLIQAACMAAGEATPIAVTAREGPKTRPDLFRDVEESIAWTMEFPDGAVAEFETSYAAEACWFRAEASRGWFALPARAILYRGIEAETSRGPLHFESPPSQQALQIDDFALCVREGRESRVPGEMGLRDVRIIEAIYESARTGKRVPVKN